MLSERIVAVHEAAHAVVLYRLLGHACGSLSIVTRDGRVGAWSDDGLSDSTREEDMRAHILSCYAGGHAQRLADPATGADGCGVDEDLAHQYMARFGWIDQEDELRAESLRLVQEYWTEIEAVASDLERLKVLDGTEVELIADAAGGDPDADVNQYRQTFGAQLSEWRKQAGA